MGTLNFIESKMSECLFCKSKNWKPVLSEVDANEYACFNCCANYYFLLTDDELERVRSFSTETLARIVSNLSDKTLFEKRKAAYSGVYKIQSERLPVLFRDIEQILFYNNVQTV